MILKLDLSQEDYAALMAALTGDANYVTPPKGCVRWIDPETMGAEFPAQVERIKFARLVHASEGPQGTFHVTLKTIEMAAPVPESMSNAPLGTRYQMVMISAAPLLRLLHSAGLYPDTMEL